MIEVMNDLPDHVLGIRATGRVTADDYRDVLVPALEKKLATHRRVRLLYLLAEDFEEYTGGAAWEDTKVGMRHLTAFERTAVVTGVEWLQNIVRALGFAFPGEVRLFDDDDVQEAREWVCEPPPTGDLGFELLEESGILVLQPHGALEAQDFERLARVVDPFVNSTGGLRGLLIDTKHFPGWEDFAALRSHLHFVRGHHEKIQRVAFVSDDRLLAALPTIASKFIAAEVRSFSSDQRDRALAWLAQA